MLKTIRKYRKSLVGVLTIASVALVMTGFGVDVFSSSSSQYAIKVGEREISFSEYNTEKRIAQDRYRQMLGENYGRLAPSLLANLGQQITQKMITEALIEQEAGSLGMSPVGPDQIRKIMVEQMFPQGFDLNQYRAFLRQVGMTAKSFERSLQQETLRQQYSGIIHDIAFVPNRELRSIIERDETKLDVELVEFKPQDFVKEVAEPSDEELALYYEETATQYEQEPRIAYGYVVFKPQDYKSLVEVLDEDIEVYYVDNQNKFSTPEKIKAQHIQLNYPEGEDPAALAEVKTRAEEAHAKAVAGEDFAGLVSEYSDDVSTKLNGGELGWVTKGERAAEFDAAVFSLKSAGIADLIETDYGFHIVRVEAHEEAKPIPLDSIRADIEDEIRSREAPAYASLKADEYYNQWISSGLSLEEFAKENSLQFAKTATRMAKRSDPTPEVKGLTQKIITFPDEEQKLVELSDKSVMVEVSEFVDSHVPELEKVRARVVNAYKVSKAAEVMRNKAAELSALLAADQELNLSAKAAEFGGKFVKRNGVSLKNPGPGLLSRPQARKAIFSAPQIGNHSAEPIDLQSSLLLYKITAVKKPQSDAIAEKVNQYRLQEEQRVAQNLVEAILNRKKLETELDVHASLMGSG